MKNLEMQKQEILMIWKEEQFKLGITVPFSIDEKGDKFLGLTQYTLIQSNPFSKLIPDQLREVTISLKAIMEIVNSYPSWLRKRAFNPVCRFVIRHELRHCIQVLRKDQMLHQSPFGGANMDAFNGYGQRPAEKDANNYAMLYKGSPFEMAVFNTVLSLQNTAGKMQLSKEDIALSRKVLFTNLKYIILPFLR